MLGRNANQNQLCYQSNLLCVLGQKSTVRMALTGTVRQKGTGGHREDILLPPARQSPSSAPYWQTLTGIPLVKENEVGGVSAPDSQSGG